MFKWFKKMHVFVLPCYIGNGSQSLKSTGKFLRFTVILFEKYTGQKIHGLFKAIHRQLEEQKYFIHFY